MVAPSSSTEGLAVEHYARRMAADLGIPDFVYLPSKKILRSGTREIGDGLLVSGDRGLIVQVKNRTATTGLTDTAERATSWVNKSIKKASSQGAGTRRSLALSGVNVTSLRGYDRLLKPTDSWPTVVVVNHPNFPSMIPQVRELTFVITLMDWRSLHTLIRSTSGIVDYVYRVVASGETAALGSELIRYSAFADADANAVAGSPFESYPTLPKTMLTLEESQPVNLFDDLIEKVADPIGSIGWGEEEYVSIVERLDVVPLLVRKRLGEKMIATYKEMLRSGSQRSFISASPIGQRDRLAFLYDYLESSASDRPEFMANLAAYAVLRQNHALEAGASSESATLATGVLHHNQRGNRYAFALVVGEPAITLPPGIRRDMEFKYGIFNGTAVEPVASE